MQTEECIAAALTANPVKPLMLVRATQSEYAKLG